MARNINDRLKSLANRRTGSDRITTLSESAMIEVLAKSLQTEPWQRRAATQPHTRYAIGAMQPVSADSTRISRETAERVGKQLENGLGIPVELQLQGSVPLDVHIRGVSDVDLLVLDDRFYTYDASGSRARWGHYNSPSTLTSLGGLIQLRGEAEKLLKAKYPAATVDCSGGKCIAIRGGSLARPVDVVPSHWHDTAAYQASSQRHDRGVRILNKKVPETIDNLPFLHIKRVHDRDALYGGGLKKAIRLAKNVKNDAENETSAAKLPSFDIAALLYHADQDTLSRGAYFELAVLQETQRFFDWCHHNKDQAQLLRTPDNSRPILNTADKFAGLTTISIELDTLAVEVAKELDIGLRWGHTWPQVTKVLRDAIVPQAA